MPRYFIDFQDGDTYHRDEHGSEVENFDQARREAIALLPQFAKDELPDGEHREFSSTVRDIDGTVLYRATLIFHGERLFNQPH